MTSIGRTNHMQKESIQRLKHTISFQQLFLGIPRFEDLTLVHSKSSYLMLTVIIIGSLSGTGG